MIDDKDDYDDHDGDYNAGDNDGDDDAWMDLNIASNFELVSCSALGGGGKAREAP